MWPFGIYDLVLTVYTGLPTVHVFYNGQDHYGIGGGRRRGTAGACLGRSDVAGEVLATAGRIAAAGKRCCIAANEEIKIGGFRRGT